MKKRRKTVLIKIKKKRKKVSIEPKILSAEEIDEKRIKSYTINFKENEK